MSGLNIYYRPQSWDEIVGNKDIVTALRTLFQRDRASLPHSFLLSGSRGCGKTTIAYLIGQELGCFSHDEGANNVDFREYDAGTTRGIDTIRNIREDAYYSPMTSPNIVFMLDECHGLTSDAQRALLKVLEDPPPHVYFILCTTDPQGLIPTIRSRCVTFEVKPLLFDDMKGLLTWVIESEEKSIPDTVVNKVIMCAEGIPRDALILLDKVMDIADPEQALQIVENEIVGESTIVDLYQLLVSDRHPDDKWKDALKILKTLKDDRGENDAEKIRRKLLGYMNVIVLNRFDPALHHKIMSFVPWWKDSFFYAHMSAVTLATYRSIYFRMAPPKLN